MDNQIQTLEQLIEQKLEPMRKEIHDLQKEVADLKA